MEIYPGEGLEFSDLDQNAYFGIDELEIYQLLGLPDKSYWEEGDIDIQYFERRLLLRIEADNHHLFGWAMVRSPEAIVYGSRILHAPRDIAIDTIVSGTNEEPEWEDYGLTEFAIFSDHRIELEFVMGAVESLNFGVRYRDDGDPIWPQRKASDPEAGGPQR